MSKYMHITIDGPSASGKSTAAKIVAKKLGYHHLDTGAIYRSVAWFLLENSIDTGSDEAIMQSLQSFKYKLANTFLKKERHYVNGRDVTGLIRSQKVSEIASKIAQFPRVRELVNRIQRNFASCKSVVVEGRDTGTVVFPNANVKFYLTANTKIRAKRRYLEFIQKDPRMKENMTFLDIEREIKQREKKGKFFLECLLGNVYEIE